MIITNDILKSCIFCKTRDFHILNNEIGVKSDYEKLIDEQTSKVKNEFIISKQSSKYKCIDLDGKLYDSSYQNYDFIFNPKFVSDKFNIQIDAIEKIKIQDTSLYIPIIFSGTENRNPDLT